MHISCRLHAACLVSGPNEQARHGKKEERTTSTSIGDTALTALEDSISARTLVGLLMVL